LEILSELPFVLTAYLEITFLAFPSREGLGLLDLGLIVYF